MNVQTESSKPGVVTVVSESGLTQEITCETKPAFVDRIDREIELAGDLSEEQKGRLHTIAEKCPLHRTLTSRIEIRTSIL
jgi:uncharacterized OsmC-like protein